MNDIRCACCGYYLGDANAACPNCLPGFAGRDLRAADHWRDVAEREYSARLGADAIAIRLRADLEQARRELTAALESAGANAEALLLARRELVEVREAATVALAALRRYESAEGYKQDWRVGEAVAHLAAALGKENGDE